MTREEAKEVFLNRGYVEVDGGTIYDADKWRQSCAVISEWLIEQDPREGHWIKTKDSYGNYHFTCSRCGYDIATKYAGNWKDNYCADCGARMIEPQKGEK